MRKSFVFGAAALIALSGHMTAASSVAFDSSWKEQGFFKFWTNDYAFRGTQLDVVSDGTVSLVWRVVEPELRSAHQASWRWRVNEGVPLTEKSLSEPQRQPDAIWLYRLPILFEWADRGDVSLGALVAHIVVHELAHHFGWTDADIARIDRWWE